MRLIPVIDLMKGQVVHAVKGDRANYLPVRSVLCDKPDPITVARAFRDRLGLSEIYVADLNAIRNSNPSYHRDFIASMARNERLDVILDAGISNIEAALEWLSLGIHKAIIGAETLSDVSAIREFNVNIDPDRLVFSMDFRAGRILSRCPELAAMHLVELLDLLQACGWRETIFLDLDRVGSEKGVESSLIKEARAAFPDIKLLIGGGIANQEQLLELSSLGVSGALVATALHRGTVTGRHVSGFLYRK